MQDVNVEEALSAPVATLHSKIQEGFSPPLQDSFLENKSRQVHSLFQRQACLLAARKKVCCNLIVACLLVKANVPVLFLDSLA